MLLRFGVSNYRSIREYAELSLIAANAIKDQGPDLLDWAGARIRVLPGIVLYGANASGKSSVHYAVGAMRSHVVRSFSQRSATAKIPRRPFMLDRTSRAEPTRFDCDFVLDEVRYHYGFEFNDSVFLKEWLYTFPEGHRRVLYYRDIDLPGIEFGKHLKGRNKAIEELTRPNSLYLSAAAQSSHPQLTPIYSFFEDRLRGLGTMSSSRKIQERIGELNEPRLVPFLQFADTGIAGLKIKDEEVDDRTRRIYASLRATLVAELGDDSERADGVADELTPNKAVLFSHAGEDGDLFELPFTAESRGTKRLSDIALEAFYTLDAGGTLFVDELDASLHTFLSLKLIGLFMSKETNPNGAQIIATTHDTNILCSGLMRRDQIWFTEKGRAGNTNLYPLTDIRTRNSDNLEKGYLQGRFGAVPFLGRIEDLLGAGNGEA